jgi:hypothetical protein
LEDKFQYVILKEPVDSASLTKSTLPVVVKIPRYLIPTGYGLLNINEGEGPYDTKFELKRYSKIFAGIKLQKHKDRILANKNIKVIQEGILSETGTTYEKTFIGALHHTMVGKISKNKVVGAHFFNSNTMKIIKIIHRNELGVYSAVIEKLHPNTGVWILKNEITTFFPDNWSAHQLFHECAIAYSNRKHDSGNVYFSKTPSGIEIKFIIDEQGKILTFYPIL